jgi:hypothetical protein
VYLRALKFTSIVVGGDGNRPASTQNGRIAIRPYEDPFQILCCEAILQNGVFSMTLDTNLLVPMTEANQNFSKVVQLVDESGMAVIVKNNEA